MGCLFILMCWCFFFGYVFWVNLLGLVIGVFFIIVFGYYKYGVLVFVFGVVVNYFILLLMVYIFKLKDLKLGFLLLGWCDVFFFGGKNLIIGFM